MEWLTQGLIHDSTQSFLSWHLYSPAGCDRQSKKKSESGLPPLSQFILPCSLRVASRTYSLSLSRGQEIWFAQGRICNGKTSGWQLRTKNMVPVFSFSSNLHFPHSANAVQLMPLLGLLACSLRAKHAQARWIYSELWSTCIKNISRGCWKTLLLWMVET